LGGQDIGVACATTHPQDLFRDCSVYCELVSIPSQLPRILEIAMRTALARGGVAVVVIPGEVFLTEAPHGAKATPVRAAPSAEVLNAASAVTILAGAGCAGAETSSPSWPRPTCATSTSNDRGARRRSRQRRGGPGSWCHRSMIMPS
jgi:hypothetical protein